MLLALPVIEPDLIRYWTLSPAEIVAIQRRRRDRNRLGFTLQLCALRYPGRLLRPGELVPPPALRYVAHQLDADPDALVAYAARFQTRYEQLEALRETFGFAALERPQRRELLAWLLPVALTTTSAPAIAATLMDELRRRQIIVPGPSVIERMVATAVLLAERQVAVRLTSDLSAEQAAALDALLRIKDGTPTSALAWARQLSGTPGHRALARLVEQLACLRAVGLAPAWLDDPHLRRRATAELNKGEARNALARAVCFHRLGRLRDRGAEAQQHRATGLALVTAAIVLWNTVYRGRALEALRRRGEDVPSPSLAHLAPLGWRHINLTGDYLWPTEAKLEPDGFRTLRTAAAMPAAA